MDSFVQPASRHPNEHDEHDERDGQHADVVFGLCDNV